MKILIVAGWIYPDVEGGSFRVIYELGKGLASLGNEVWVLSRKLSPGALSEETIAGMHILRYPSPEHGLPFYLLTAARTRNLVNRLHRTEQFDVINCHHLVPALGTYLIQYPNPIYILNLHALYFLERMDRLQHEEKFYSSYDPVSRFIKLFESVLLKKSSLIIAHSNFTKELIRKYFPSQLSKVVTIPPGVDISEFRFVGNKNIPRQKLGLPLEKPVLLTVRRLEYRMGLENLIKAMRDVVRKIPEVQLLITGKGNLRSRLDALIRQYKLEKCIKLTGFVPAGELPAYYQAADIFVIPTRALEGFGMVTLEAMACGTPVLGTPVGGTKEILGDFEPSLLFRNTTPEAIAEKLILFLENKNSLQELGRRSRKYVETNYTWEKTCMAYQELLKDTVLEKSRGAAY